MQKVCVMPVHFCRQNQWDEQQRRQQQEQARQQQEQANAFYTQQLAQEQRQPTYTPASCDPGHLTHGHTEEEDVDDLLALCLGED